MSQPAFTAIFRVNYYMGRGYSKQPYTTAHLTADTLPELVREMSQRFPMKVCSARLDMHNGAGLDIRASLAEGGDVPSDRVRHSVVMDAVVSAVGGITDVVWADLVEALAPRCKELDAGRAPSSRLWSHGLMGAKRHTSCDADAIARVDRMMSTPLWTVTYPIVNEAGTNTRASFFVWEPTEEGARATFATAHPDSLALSVSAGGWPC